MAERLPQVVILQSKFNEKYLHYNNAIAGMPDNLQFQGDYSFTLETRFVLELATTGGGLYHIRSMYNNKYFSRDISNGRITASATKPEEDRSVSLCTLYEPVFVDAGDNRTVRFHHINSGNYVCWWTSDPLCLVANFSSPDANRCDVFTIIDWLSIVMFPNRIVIKGDNDLYLCTGKDGLLSFSRGTQDMNEDVEYEVTPSRNGGIRVKSVTLGRYWRSDDNGRVVADGNCPSETHSTDTVFLPMKLDNNDIALRCLKNNLYCKRYNSDNPNCLATVNSYIESETHMVIEEPVLSRKISNVNYRLTDARISNEKVFLIMNQEVINRTKETDMVAIDIKYTDTQTSAWNASVSLTLGVKTEISADVPLLGKGSIEFSGEFENSYQWGEIIERKIEVEPSFNVPIPPMSRVVVSMMVSQASFDIPFSYTRHDVLKDGTTKVYKTVDGWYTGFNSYNYRYQTEQYPLDDPAS